MTTRQQEKGMTRSCIRGDRRAANHKRRKGKENETETERHASFNKRKRHHRRGDKDLRCPVVADKECPVQSNSEEDSDVGEDERGSGNIVQNEDAINVVGTTNTAAGACNIEGQMSNLVPGTVVAGRSDQGTDSTTSSLQQSSVLTGSGVGDGSTIVSALTRGSRSIRSGRKSEMTFAMHQKFGAVKGAVRKTVFREIKFLGSSNSLELNWDRPVAGLVYDHLDMNGWSNEKKKTWWEADNYAVPKWVAETLAMKRSEVTQGMRKRFFGK